MTGPRGRRRFGCVRCTEEFPFACSESSRRTIRFGWRECLHVERNSLFLVAGNASLTLRSGSELSGHPPSEAPDLRRFPCIFPAYQGSAVRDEFVLDSPHPRESSCPSTPSTATESSVAETSRHGLAFGSEFPRNSRGFGVWGLMNPNWRRRVYLDLSSIGSPTRT